MNYSVVAPGKKRQGLISTVRNDKYASILSTLGVLDRLLASALASAREASADEEAAVEQFHGLYLTHDGVERLLASEPGAPAFSPVE